MAEISTVNGLSVNPIQNAQLKRRYDHHISKILAISQKKSSVKLISEEQRKISDILKKSKEKSKHFKEREFMVKCDAENKRLLKSLSTINARQRAKTDRD
jgi:phage gp16-like protein